MKKTILFGAAYEFEVEDKPEYQRHGTFVPVLAVCEIAKKYRSLTDEQIIQELKALRTKSHGEKAPHWETEEHSQIQLERQLLTIAFALNHGIDGKAVELLCIIDSQFKVLFWFYMAIYFDLVKIWNERNPCLNQEQLDIFLQERKKIKEETEAMRINAKLSDGFLPLPHDIVCDMLEKNGLISTLDKMRTDMYFRFSTVEHLKKDGIFPPYGIALSIFYEDPGLDILPWNRDFTDILKAKLLNTMHNFADSSASIVYKVILAAFCCQCFEEVPSFKSVQQEFRTTKLNKGKYSSSVNIPLKEAYIDWRPRNRRAAEDAINERRIDPDKEILLQIKSIIATL